MEYRRWYMGTVMDTVWEQVGRRGWEQVWEQVGRQIWMQIERQLPCNIKCDTWVR
jgi:hypothetical protein